MRDIVERISHAFVAFVMTDKSKAIARIIVCAPQRGKLTLEWNYDDGTSAKSRTDVSTIHRILAAHGQKISAEWLSKIAFCGGRLVLTRRV
jgi:hypothetical protein